MDILALTGCEFLERAAPRRGHQGSQRRHARAERSEKGVVLQDRSGMKLCVITAFFARALQMCLDRPCTRFLLIRQEVRAIGKTRNQLIPS
jgi:hypothetical protein